MKTIYTLLFFCGLFIAMPLNAQNQSSLAELLERKNKTTHECVTSVFNAEEIAILRAHFGHDDNSVPFKKNGPVNWIYGIENVSEVYGNFDADDPSTFNEIAASPINGNNFEGAGAINEKGDMAYVVDNNNNFYSLAILTGIYTLLGVLNPPAGESITGLEFDPTDGTLFALSTDAIITTLLIINIVAVTVAIIGITGMVLGIGLAAGPAGNLFAVDIDNDYLWQINKLTAFATIVGFIGFDANFAQGMALSFLTGLVLIAAFNNTIFDSELYVLNLVTGLATLIGIIIVGTLAQFGWIGIPNPTLGVGDISQNGFRVYPNPAGNSIFLQAQDMIESISIFDMMGQRVLYQPVDALNSQVDISYLASGHYICTAVVNGQVGTYKLIKQ